MTNTIHLYKGFKITVAPLRGRYVGAIDDGANRILNCDGKNIEEVRQKLVNHINANTYLSFKYAPVVEKYRSLDVSCQKYDDHFVAIATLAGVMLFEANSELSQIAAVHELKTKIDSSPERIDQAIVENHKKMLTEYGVNGYSGIKAKRTDKSKTYRFAHCWACHHPIDNASYYECDACGGIICFCGACHCSYENRAS